MKRLFAIAGLVAALMLTACATPVPTATLNDKEAIALRSVTTARQVSMAALAAHKINVGQDQKTQATLDLTVTAIAAARAANDAAGIDAAKAKADALAANPGAPAP